MAANRDKLVIGCGVVMALRGKAISAEVQADGERRDDPLKAASGHEHHFLRQVVASAQS
jgi:hypothetical protein